MNGKDIFDRTAVGKLGVQFVAAPEHGRLVFPLAFHKHSKGGAENNNLTMFVRSSVVGIDDPYDPQPLADKVDQFVINHFDELSNVNRLTLTSRDSLEDVKRLMRLVEESNAALSGWLVPKPDVAWWTSPEKMLGYPVCEANADFRNVAIIGGEWSDALLMLRNEVIVSHRWPSPSPSPPQSKYVAAFWFDFAVRHEAAFAVGSKE